MRSPTIPCVALLEPKRHPRSVTESRRSTCAGSDRLSIFGVVDDALTVIGTLVAATFGNVAPATAGSRRRMRKLIAFDDDTFDKLKQLARDRMATIQDWPTKPSPILLRKHGIPSISRTRCARAHRSRIRRRRPAPDRSHPGKPDYKADRAGRDAGPIRQHRFIRRPQPIFFRPFLNRGPLPT